MSDRKTAAELRELAYMFPSGTWRALLLHHAAVEEEREAATAEPKAVALALSLRADLDAAIARAESAEKRVAELEARAERIHDDAVRAGIREGLERAAVWLEKNTWNTHAPSFVRALKEQVK